MEPTSEQKNNWHSNPKNWKLGVFYYNPEDPRGLVDKKFTNLGATINFANKTIVKRLIIILVSFVALLFLAILFVKK